MVERDTITKKQNPILLKKQLARVKNVLN